MSGHLYAFGSLCRGELDELSDIDLLACVATQEEARQVDSSRFSVYTYERIRALWIEGNPFAWHLYLESRLLYSPDGADFIRSLGAPHAYQRVHTDCAKFLRLFEESAAALRSERDSKVFHLSCIFLAARNFATCLSFLRGMPIFSRRSPLKLEPRLPIGEAEFDLLIRARVLSTRGAGPTLTPTEISMAAATCSDIQSWMESLLPEEVTT